MAATSELTALRARVATLEAENTSLRASASTLPAALSNAEIARYGRQLLLPQVGLPGQVRLKRASVLVVGAGGLGCPAATYLAAAGIGRLGLVDADNVDSSNLHRQILHTEATEGMPKAHSAAAALRRLNSHVVVQPYVCRLDNSNALSLVADYDVILDATDNAATRYLLNDACVLQGKPLVSGAALRTEGQLTIYHHAGGPCYRCMFPVPPPATAVTNCSEGGVLGVVPGIIGSLQAMEAIKLVLQTGLPCAQRMLLFDGLEGSFRSIKLRPRRKDCAVCGDHPTVTTELLDYEAFCGAAACDTASSISVLPPEHRLTCSEYATWCREHRPHVLLDVRPPVEFGICALPASLNIPLPELQQEGSGGEALLLRLGLCKKAAEQPAVLVVCRRGNDSQLAVPILQRLLPGLEVRDLRGGLVSWAKLHPAFPVY